MAYINHDFDSKKARVVEQFLQKFGATATITYRQEAKYNPVSFDFNKDPYFNYSTSIMKETVPIVNMEIREDQLRSIVERLEDLEEMQRRYGPNIEFVVKETMQAQASEWRESRIRKENPGVQLAWEKYQMMLKIAGG
jgi:DNA repair ATPase RecN